MFIVKSQTFEDVAQKILLKVERQAFGEKSSSNNNYTFNNKVQLNVIGFSPVWLI